MISREHLHEQVLKTINEQYNALAGPPTRYGLAWAIVNGLHPVLIEQIQREVETAMRAAHLLLAAHNSDDSEVGTDGA